MIAKTLADARQLLLDHGCDGAEQMLYTRWYHNDSGPMSDYPSAMAYRAAILNTERLEAGWTITAIGGGIAGSVTVRRGALERLVAPPDYVPANAGHLIPRVGDDLLVDPFSWGAHGGFWHVWSPAWQDARPATLSRLYFNVKAGCERMFARLVLATASIEDNWSAKFICGGRVRRRHDTALVYHDATVPVDNGWLAQLIDAGEALTTAPLPPFVRPCRLGIGTAPEPCTGESYGQALCRCIAEAARDNGALSNTAAWEAAAVAHLAEVVPAEMLS